MSSVLDLAGITNHVTQWRENKGLEEHKYFMLTGHMNCDRKYILLEATDQK